MLIAGEQVTQPLALLVGEQVGPGVEHPSSTVERVVLASAVAVGDLLDSTSAPIEGVAGQAHYVEGIHHRGRLGKLLGGSGLEAGEAVHRHDLDTVAPLLWSCGEPGLERGLGAALDHVEKPRWACAVADRGEVDDDGDVFVATPGVPPDVLIDAQDLHAIEPGGVVGECPRIAADDLAANGARWLSRRQGRAG